MKKMVAAFDGLKYAAGTRDYAIALAKMTGLFISGLFIDDPLYSSYSVYDLLVNKEADEDLLETYKQKDEALRAEGALDFEAACTVEKIAYSIHRDTTIGSHRVMHESLYADLLLISKNESLTRMREHVPSYFIRDLLENAQCPVMLLPEKYTPVKKIVLLYDGAPSSVYAIKMLSYLLPELTMLDIEILKADQHKHIVAADDQRLMAEFADRHYPNAKHVSLSGLPELVIPEYLSAQPKSTLAVLGAYRRGSVSRWFRESMADLLMKETGLPLFIAHHK